MGEHREGQVVEHRWLLFFYVCCWSFCFNSRGDFVNVIILQRGNDFKITENLSSKEIECKCGRNICQDYLFSSEVINKFQELRDDFGAPIKINSGFRCQSHNHGVGGRDNSKHKLGMALDLSVDKINLDALELLAQKYFDTVLRYETFIHVHMGPEYEQ